MAETLTQRLVLPELPVHMNGANVLGFMRSLFALNGLLDKTDLQNGKFFEYTPGDDAEKRHEVTRYLAPVQDKPCLILGVKAIRHSETEFHTNVREAVKSWNNGYDALASSGNERYSVATLPDGPGLDLAKELLVIQNFHRLRNFKSSETNLPNHAFPNPYGRLVIDAACEVRQNIIFSRSDQNRVNARAVQKLIELL
jgi:hypothetical protein